MRGLFDGGWAAHSRLPMRSATSAENAKRLPSPLASAAGVRDEMPAPVRLDELYRAARPGREADAEDRADVGLEGARQHAFGQAARGLDGLALKQALPQRVDRWRRELRFLEARAQLGPELLRGALRVVVVRSTSSSPCPPGGSCPLRQGRRGSGRAHAPKARARSRRALPAGRPACRPRAQHARSTARGCSRPASWRLPSRRCRTRGW